MEQDLTKKILVVFRVKKKRTIEEIQKEYFDKGLISVSNPAKEKQVETRKDFERNFRKEKQSRKLRQYRSLQKSSTEEILLEYSALVSLEKEMKSLTKEQKERFVLLSKELYIRNPEIHNF